MPTRLLSTYENGFSMPVADTSLRSEVHDAFELLVGEELGHTETVGEIALDEFEPRVLPEQLHARPFQIDVVVIVQVVEPD